jgi:hypothetical protein
MKRHFLGGVALVTHGSTTNDRRSPCAQRRH